MDIQTIAQIDMEPVWLFTRLPDVNSLEQLRGKPVAIGRPGSGSYPITLDLLEQEHLGPQNLAEAPHVSIKTADDLRQAKVDAAMFVIGFDAPLLHAMSQVPGIRLVNVAKAYGKDRRRWSWGEANPLATRHPLGRVPGLSWVFDPPFRLPMSGAPQAVRVHGPSLGQSMRWIVDWGNPEASTLVVPFGVSGHVGSPHRLDQLPFWRDGDPVGAATRLSRAASGANLDFRP